ncbi:zinc-dependent metalloprotease [Flavobacterium sp.]|uniref:zinc-dependent metalloprotease n=1 Tax=Flavobacterium sp. TaxID=239 RepID=UPI00248A41A3|nr:zinc-dependent metalloprotease [Flavobacterium sp.]MDI1318387.1 zinc-dependent metalloprotease [Flavobacterium sp.]
MKLKLLFLLLIFQFSFAQQRTCGAEQQMEIIMNNPVQRQAYIEQQNKFEIELQRLEANSARNANAVIRIPVAVHYPSAGAVTETVKTCLRNLAQRQVNILNADYNGTNTDISNWASVSGNYPETNTGSLNVQFVIATENHPAGTGLNNGDLAVTFGTDFLTAGNISCTDGCNEDATWSGYMNLVVKNIAGGILGFSPVGGTPATGKTVVIDNNAFGASLGGSTPNCAGFVPGAPYNKGRTLTHELGHFFNLNHTFAGCDGANCASSGDRVCDTPSTNQPRYDCNDASLPPDPNVSGNPAVTTCGYLQLTMNYMDYVQDSCMYMFTAGQAARMQAWYNTIASQFTTTALANDAFLQKEFSIYPNPNNGTFTIEFKELANSFSVEVFDISGKIIYENNYDQSANLIQEINLNKPASGVYFVNIKSDKGLVTKKLIVQ